MEDTPAQDATGRRAQIEKRVRDGEWITTGDLAALLGVTLREAVYLVDAGHVAYRRPSGNPHGWRALSPEDVLTQLERSRVVHRAPQRRQRGTPPAADAS